MSYKEFLDLFINYINFYGYKYSSTYNKNNTLYGTFLNNYSCCPLTFVASLKFNSFYTITTMVAAGEHLLLDSKTVCNIISAADGKDLDSDIRKDLENIIKPKNTDIVLRRK